MLKADYVQTPMQALVRPGVSCHVLCCASVLPVVMHPHSMRHITDQQAPCCSPPPPQAALFRQLLAGAEEASRRVALGSGVHVGEEVMGPEEIAAAQRLREDQHRAHTALTEAAAAARLEAVLEPAGALHLPAAQPGEEVTAGPLAGSAAFAAVAVAGQPGAPPAWRLIEANNLKARADVLLKFQRAVWRIISVRRLRRALVRIRDVLGQLGWDKQRLAEEAANPVLLVSEADRPGGCAAACVCLPVVHASMLAAMALLFIASYQPVCCPGVQYSIAGLRRKHN